ncbi:unnamed protein product [Anisakis simplex]|nr:unnamed protein product [Anisakis simplex]
MGYRSSSLQNSGCAVVSVNKKLPSFTICGQIGKAYSGLAEVLLVRRDRKNLSALRILSTEFIDYEQIKKEVWLLRWLSHANIIAFECAFSVNTDIYVLSPFYDLG